MTPWAAARLGVLATVAVRLVCAAPRPSPHSRLPPPPRPTHGAVSVVVPARDEAARLAPLLERILGAPGVTEVVVVDDRSADATASVARRLGAVVIDGTDPPPGWVGKTWAMEQGLRAASGEWVVFLDADVRPDPELCRRLVDAAVMGGFDLVSAAGRFDVPAAAAWLHASMLATLVYRGLGPGAQRPGRESVNGQCLAARREALLVAGGLAGVAGSVVEDVGLARRLARHGWSIGFVEAFDLMTVEPYRSVGEVWLGWGRSIGLPGVEPRWRVVAEAAVLAIAMPLPVFRLVVRRGDLVDVALLSLRLGVLAGTRRAYTRSGAAFWCSPLADTAAVAAVGTAALRRTVRWRGRSFAVVR